MAIKINGKLVAGIGAPGKSAYDGAKENGYTGTESEFYALLANIGSEDSDSDLGIYSEHWWSGYLEATSTKSYSESQKPIVSNVELFSGNSTYDLYYSPTLIIDQYSGRFDLDNSQKFSISKNTLYGRTPYIDEDEGIGSYSEVSDNAKRIAEQIAALAPCYISFGGTSSSIYYLPAGSTGGMGVPDQFTVESYVDEGTESYEYEDEDGEVYEEEYGYWIGKVFLNIQTSVVANLVSIVATTSKTEEGDLFYVHSSDRNAYPDSGTVDGYHYRYIGVPLDKITYDTHRVGAIVNTTRSPLGENWLLTNGAYITRDEYPSLYDMLGYQIDEYNYYGMHTRMSIDKSLKCLYAYGNDLVCVDSSYYIYHASLDNISGTYTKVGTSYYYGITKVYCHDGLWVAAGSSTSSTMAVYYATDPTGTWTSKSISTKYGYVKDIQYAGGKWIIVASGPVSNKNYYRLYVYISDDPTTKNWTTIDTGLDVDGTTSHHIIASTNGYLVIAETGENSDGNHFAAIIVSTDSGSSWSRYSIDSDIGSGGYVYALYAYEGKFYCTYSKYHVRGYSNFIATTEDPTGSWDIRRIEMSSSNFSDGLWLNWNSSSKLWYLSEDMCYTFNCLGELRSPNDSWTTTSVTPSTNVVITEDKRVFFGNGTYLYYSKKDIRARRVPTLSTEGVYTYIKAKEEI